MKGRRVVIKDLNLGDKFGIKTKKGGHANTKEKGIPDGVRERALNTKPCGRLCLLLYEEALVSRAQ
jgi:hypothetical protein